MTVRELIELLKTAPEDSVVLFIDQYGDADGTEEIRQVDVRPELWLHERGKFRGESYDVRYPATLKDPREEPGYTDVTHEPEDVVVLSSGPTNLRFPR